MANEANTEKTVLARSTAWVEELTYDLSRSTIEDSLTLCIRKNQPKAKSDIENLTPSDSTSTWARRIADDVGARKEALPNRSPSGTRQGKPKRLGKGDVRSMTTSMIAMHF